MTWTTSADPWANGIRKDAVRNLHPAQFKLLISSANFIAPIVPALAVGHLCLIAIFTPALAAPEVCALLMMSGLALLVAAVAAIRNRFGDAIAEATETHTSPLQLHSLAAVEANLPRSPVAASSPIAMPPRAASDCTFRANAHNSDWPDLMARVSHELRTPLNAVLGFSDLMDRGTFGPLGHHRYQEYARHIHQSGRDLLKSAEDTLAVTSLLTSASRSTATEVIDFAELAADAWAFFGRLPHTKDVSLALDVPVGTEIVCDRRTIRQVLVNLLSEALTRSVPGSTITLATTIEFGQVGVTVAVPPSACQSSREPGSLDVCLARTLLEFHGALLVEHLSCKEGWRTTTYLERASQPDFFAAAAAGAEQRLMF